MSEHLHSADYPQVEPEGLNAGILGVIVVGGLLLILAATFVVVSVTELVFQEAQVTATEFTGYPALSESNKRARQILSSYAPIDRDAGVYRIPIDRAMELIVAEAGGQANSSGN